MAFPADPVTMENQSPWEDDDDINWHCCIDGNFSATLNLHQAAKCENYQFEIFKGDAPMPCERFRIEARSNVVQLTLEHASRSDTGHYSLNAKRHSNENESERLFKRRVYMSVDEPSFFEEGDPPLFLRRLSDLTVKVGTRTRFLVEIRSTSETKVTWHRNDEPIKPGSRFSFVHEGNFFCVDVAPVTVEDQGHWTCMAENRSGRSSCTSHLNIIVPKAYKRPEFASELRALLTEFGSVSLECKVIGVPTPVLRWFKDNKEIKAGDVFALSANPDDPTSLGTYTCQAINCMGIAYSSSRVHVVGKGSREGSLKPADALIVAGDPPIFKRSLKDDCCRIGDSLYLACQVQVPPWPKEIAWYNKEGHVKSGDRYKIMEDGLGGYSIQIQPVEAADEGEWKCVATSHENIKQFTTCYVAMSIPRNYRKPRFMESLTAVLTEEGLVSFECKVVGFPTPLLRWFKDGKELKPGDVYQLTGTNSLGTYCCVAKNCMGEATSTAELTLEDIKNQLNDEERLQLLTINQPPKFIKGLKSCEAKICSDFKFTVQVSVMPVPNFSWYRDDHLIENEDRYQVEKENTGVVHLNILKLEFCDQAEWKCVASNDFGHSVTSCFLKLIIPRHYRKPKFLENLRAILSEGGAVNLECKVIGVPQPTLKWYKDGEELKPGDIHKIISGQDGTCSLGTYTCEATNCMGTVSSSASLLGYEDRISPRQSGSAISAKVENELELARNLSLSTINEERTSQLLETALTDQSITERGEISFTFDGKDVSVSLYETPDLTEEEAYQIIEMYADQLSEHVSEHNVVELPPMRFVKETSTSGNLYMQAVVIDVSPDYFASIEENYDQRTEADLEEISTIDVTTFSSPMSGSFDDEGTPVRPPRRNSEAITSKVQEHTESYHSAPERDISLNLPDNILNTEADTNAETFMDALSRAQPCDSETRKKDHSRKRSNSGDSYGTATDLLLDQTSSPVKKKKEEMTYHTETEKQFGQKCDFEEPNLTFVDQIPEDVMHQRSCSSMHSEKEKLFLKNDEKQFIELLRKIAEPVLVVRRALIDSDFIFENEQLINSFVTENVLIPIQNLYDTVTDVESKALNNAEDRSFIRDISISILEIIGGPAEELLRAFELIHQENSDGSIRINLSILESLVDPVDEILFGLAKLEFDLCDQSISVNPIVLDRIIRTTSRYRDTLQKSDGNINETMMTALQKIHSALSTYLNKISVNQFGIWNENIDAVLVESLARPLEDLQRASECILLNNSIDNMEKMLEVFNEILSRLEALVVALEGYEGDYRASFVVDLKKSIVIAAEVLSEMKNDKMIYLSSLPELILDNLVDTQACVNAVIIDLEKSHAQSSSKLISDLVELREHLAFAVHKTTTLKAEEMIAALGNLEKPLINLRLSLTNISEPTEFTSIRNVIQPLITLQSTFSTLLQNIETQEEDDEISTKLQPVNVIIEDLKKNVLLISDEINVTKYESESKFDEQREIESSVPEVLYEMQFASQLGTVHYEIASILEKYEQLEGADTSLVLHNLNELRASIGNAAIAIDSIISSFKLNIDGLTHELLELEMPLNNVNDVLINEKYLSVQTDVLVELQQPMERLKIIIQNFVKQIDQESVASPVVEAIVNIQKTLSLFMNSNFPIPNDNYDTTDFANVTKIRDPVSQEDNNKEFIESHGIKSHESENDEFLEKRTAYPEDIFFAKISQSLNEIEQNIVHILDKFDQELVLVSSPIASRLAEALDGLRKTILVVRSNLSKIALEFTDVKFDSSQSDSQQNTECISSALEELLCPILEVREALTQTETFKAPEMLILKQLDQPMKAIESNVLFLALEAQSRVIDSGKSSGRACLDTIARVLKDIESQIPIALDAVNHREKMLSTLYDNLKPLEIIKDRISEILSDSSNGDNIEFDVADILIKPVDSLKLILHDFFDQIDAGGALSCKDKNVISSLNGLIEPFIELQSALSVVRNSRRTSMVEPALQDEKKNVILKAVKELRLGIENIHFNVKKEENDSAANATPILVSVDDLDSALQLVQNRISETKYIRRRSCLRSLQERVSMPLKQLEQKIKLLEKELDHQILNLISESLETLLKQIQSVQEQFIDSSTQVIDEEAIIEGFLYPTQRLLTSLENLEQNKVLSRVKNHKIFLNHLAHCIAHFSNTLLTLKNELVQEGVSENISVIETLNAVLIPTNKIEKVLYEITKPIEDEEQDHEDSIDSFQKVEMRSGEQVSTVLTTVETIVDEFIEVSKHETESLTMMKVATEDNIDNEYNSGLLPLELGSDYCEFEMHLEDIETLLPNLKANESSAVSTVQSDSGISEGVDNTSMHVIGSTPSFVEEEQSSITALWSLIKEPLNKLQECISTITNVPFTLESVDNRDEEATYEKNIISSRLENLKESISVMEKIALEGTEQINLSSWPENSLPALQNLAWSLEELGENLPIIISKSQITLEDSTENEMYQSITAMSALKTLIAPLHDLKQRLGLIVDEKDQEQSQIIIESEVNDMERENIKIKHEKCEKSISNEEKPIIEELSETNDLNQSHNKKQKLENYEIYEQRKGEEEEEEDKKYNEPLENDVKQTIFTQHQPTERLKNQEDDSVTEKTTNKLKEPGTEKEKKEETKHVKKEEERSCELKKDENLKKNENKIHEVEAAKGLELDKETNEKLGESKKLCLVTEEKKIEQEYDGYVEKEENEKREQPQTEHPKEEKHELGLEKAELPLEVTNEPNEIKQTESLQETELFYQEKTADQNYAKEDKNEKKTNDSESLKQEDVKHKQVQSGPLEEEQKKQEEAQAEKLKTEEDKIKQVQAEMLKQEKTEKETEAEVERLKQEEEEHQKKSEAERQKKEEEEKEMQTETERLKREEEKQKQAKAERLKKEEEEKQKQTEAENLRKEQEEEREKQAEPERLKREEKEKKKQAEAEADRLNKEDEEKKIQAKAEKLRKAEEEENEKQAEAERLKREEEEKQKLAEAEHFEKEKEEMQKEAEAEKLRIEEEERQKQAEGERLKKEEEEKQKQAEAERLRKEEEEERVKQAEAERSKREEEERRKQVEAERLKREEEEKQKQAEAEKLRKEEEEKQKQAEAEKLRKEEEEKQKQVEVERLKKEEEEKQKQAEAELRKEEEVRQKQAEAERLKKEEEERQKQAEAERLRKEEEERQKQAEGEKLRKEEEERQKQAEDERLKREEEEKQKQAEAEKLRKEEEERQKQAEAEQEEERQKQAEAERLKKEEEEKRKQAEAERLTKEEEERQKQAEVEQEERQKQADAERLKKEEEEKQKQAEAEKLRIEEEERQKQAEAERLRKEEEERQKQAEAERLKKEEEEKQKQAEAERQKKEEEEKQKQAEAERLRKEEEEERVKQAEAERSKREEEERQKQVEAERLKREEEEKQKQAEAEKLRKEEEERQKQAEGERLKKEEEEKQKQDEAQKLRKEDEEKQKQAEAERLKKGGEEKQKQTEVVGREGR
ncbi:titin homolog [Trichogramma pretiosum]|uniref:titin homolog n=1 Tax=Trichogramma pretiosum TaxID=7493 RepID=UPI000C71B436|nr:titin homolog [Trichogramma pretiosum]